MSSCEVPECPVDRSILWDRDDWANADGLYDNFRQPAVLVCPTCHREYSEDDTRIWRQAFNREDV